MAPVDALFQLNEGPVLMDFHAIVEREMIERVSQTTFGSWRFATGVNPRIRQWYTFPNPHFLPLKPEMAYCFGLVFAGT